MKRFKFRLRLTLLLGMLLLVIVFLWILFQIVWGPLISLPGFSVYTKCIGNACVLTERPKSDQELYLYNTVCCGFEMKIGCTNQSMGLIGNQCRYICVGEYFRQGGVNKFCE